MTKREQFCVVWRSDPTTTTVNVLSYQSDGAIRTYNRASLDSRIGDVVFVETLGQALVALRPGDGTRIAIPIAVARQLGTRDWKFEE